MKYIILFLSAAIILSCATAVKTTQPKAEDDSKDVYTVNDIWLLETMNSQPIQKIGEGNKIPQLEIHVKDKRYLGNDGCNQISGGLKVVNETNLVFGVGIGTKMMCPDMSITNRFNKLLPKVKAYKIEKLNLYLYDSNGAELLQFKKID